MARVSHGGRIGDRAVYVRVATIFTNVYKDIWEAAIGEELPCEQETMNTKDRYAVAVKKDGMVVGQYLECYKFHT